MTRLPRWADLVLVPLISLALAFAISALVILSIGQNPVEALKVMVTGALGSSYGWGYTLYYATNFIFTGLAVAVAAHIAGGHARDRAEFLESLTVATASLREVETLLLAATRVCLLSGDQIQTAMQLGDEVGRMLTALRRSLGAPHLQPGASAHPAVSPPAGVNAGPAVG